MEGFWYIFIEVGVIVLKVLYELEGMQAVFIEDVVYFIEDMLEQFLVVVFLNIIGDVLDVV